MAVGTGAIYIPVRHYISNSANAGDKGAVQTRARSRNSKLTTLIIKYLNNYTSKQLDIHTCYTLVSTLESYMF